MKKGILIIIFLSMLVSCQESKLELKLINKEILSKGFSIDTINAFYDHCKFNNENEKYLFTNVVKFQLSNNTDKKYLLYIKDLKLSDIYNFEILIEDEKGNLLQKNRPLIDPSYTCKLGSLIEQNFYEQHEKEFLLRKNGYNIKNENLNFHNQEMIISPKESYIFHVSLPLPFMVEDKDENIRRPVYFKLNPKKKYTFRLKYKLKDDIEKIIPKDIMSNYKENNIEIFKGEIETQKIPIIFK
ncbi:hypothetical protein [Flavobacterium notoginsengisoli]|uniref:hypothetical protein n=1 Tax=Flavobacterium notoginsengisoli TaxID=1478199 RepID=UPI00363367AA